MEQDKKERVAKNKKQQLNNLKAAACSNNRVPGGIRSARTLLVASLNTSRFRRD